MQFFGLNCFFSSIATYFLQHCCQSFDLKLEFQMRGGMYLQCKDDLNNNVKRNLALICYHIFAILDIIFPQKKP